jgi:glyoxylase-like metal-dependent hydrolase (beta-lactamase superfamily II)
MLLIVGFLSYHTRSGGLDMRRATLAAVFVLSAISGLVVVEAVRQQAERAPLEKPVKLADGAWLRQSHDIGKFGSNVGWIEFSDFVVVVDTAFPLGAEEALARIKETTGGKKIRYAIVTHYHADHSFGTGVFAMEGATIVAHENARQQYLAKNVSQYEAKAKTDEAYGRYKAYAPDLTFTDKFIIDDGKRRAEVHFYGQAHTTGCIFTWMPKEKVVYTGDACVNGPFNYMGDSDSASWIEVLTRVQALEPDVVAPGHGAVGKRDLLETQKKYFQELRSQVGELAKAGKTLDEVKKTVDIPMWKKWTGQEKMNEANISHVYGELTRRPEK